VDVSGSVFRLAVPQVTATPIVLAARVGDVSPSASVAVANAGPDAFTERLNAGWASPAPAGFTLTGSVTGLASGSSSALGVSLPTTTAGSFSGSGVVTLVSSGVGTTGAPDAALGSTAVPLTGRVYAPAVASVAPVVDFGTVRVGDTVAARGVSVANTAGGALTDRLDAGFGPAAGPFTTAGSLSGLQAGQSNATALTVQLGTAAAGVFQATANVALASTNPDLPARALPAAPVQLQGTVNRLAGIDLQLGTGTGALSFDGLVAPNTLRWTLNLGSVVEGLGTASANLLLLNPAAAPADSLAGSWVPGPDTGGFSLAGFGSFGLGAGQGTALGVTLLDGTVGAFERTVGFQGLSVNGFGPDLPIASVELRLLGEVAPIPEPGTYALMLAGLAGIAALARRRRAAVDPQR
jgi:hypothetical protein